MIAEVEPKASHLADIRYVSFFPTPQVYISDKVSSWTLVFPVRVTAGASACMITLSTDPAGFVGLFGG